MSKQNIVSSRFTGDFIGGERKPAYIPAEVAIEQEPLRVTLMQLGRCTCRWPVTKSPPHLFCGHLTDDGKPYCPSHMKARKSRGLPPPL